MHFSCELATFQAFVRADARCNHSANVATQAPILLMEDMRFHDIVFREVFQFSSVDSGFGAARPIHTVKLEMSFPRPIFYSQSLSHLQDRLNSRFINFPLQLSW